ncbi:MAG: hydroxymethylbilane synthase [Myxococcales bacterium]|nr:hydroxymethylbilane synthase [Myxococcales bacterium]
MRTFTVGTRGSALALWQTRHVTSLLSAKERSIAERIITTEGDVNLTERLQGSLEKGFFSRELEAALHANEIDWAVHSLKDLPTRSPVGLTVGATLRRAPAGDLLILRPEAYDEQAGLLPLRRGAKVGSSSSRREALLRSYCPHCSPQPLRGNVPTRVEKLKSGQYDGILLAEAGVARLGVELSGLVVLRLNPRRWVCAPGQGSVAVQCRADDVEVRQLLSALDDGPTRHATTIERDFLRVLEGGCTTPFGCFVDGDRAFLGLLAGTAWHQAQVPLPAELPTTEWLQQQLDSLSRSSREIDHEWLARRL